jgi:hypothetical protein
MIIQALDFANQASLLQKKPSRNCPSHKKTLKNLTPSAKSRALKKNITMRKQLHRVLYKKEKGGGGNRTYVN